MRDAAPQDFSSPFANPRAPVRVLEGQLGLLERAIAKVRADTAPAAPVVLPAPPVVALVVASPVVMAVRTSVEAEPDAADAYVARLIAPQKRAFASALLAWMRAGSVGDPPLPPAKLAAEQADDVRVRLKRFVKVAPKPAKPKLPRQVIEVAVRAKVARETALAKPPRSPRMPAVVPTEALVPAVRQLPVPTFADAEAANRWLHDLHHAVDPSSVRVVIEGRSMASGHRHADLSVTERRRHALEACSLFARGIASVRETWGLDKYSENYARDFERACPQIAEAPVPWEGAPRGGALNKALTEAWDAGALRYDWKRLQWQYAGAHGVSGKEAYELGSRGKRAPRTAERVRQELDVLEDANFSDLPHRSRAERGDFDNILTTAHGRQDELARELNALAPATARVEMEWWAPALHRSGRVDVRIHRKTYTDRRALSRIFDQLHGNITRDARGHEVVLHSRWSTKHYVSDKRDATQWVEAALRVPEDVPLAELREVRDRVVRALRAEGYAIDAHEEVHDPAADAFDPALASIAGLFQHNTASGAPAVILVRRGNALTIDVPAAGDPERLPALVARARREEARTGTTASAVVASHGRLRQQIRAGYGFGDHALSGVVHVGAAYGPVRVYDEDHEAVAKELRRTLDHLHLDVSVATRGPSETERRRPSFDPGLGDWWSWQAGERVRAGAAVFFADLARLLKSKPAYAGIFHESWLRAVREGVAALAEGRNAWAGLRAGSPNARAVTAAVRSGALTYSHSYDAKRQERVSSWKYRDHEGRTAWEAFRAGGGAS